jgi:hypothetical protein
MFLLLDQNREPIAEIHDYLSVIMNIRFSRPGSIDMIISEKSEIVTSLRELTHVYHVETQTLFLIEYLNRDILVGDSTAINVKGTTMEGFWEQRIIFTDKILEDVSIQDSIRDLISENVISPEDTTRTLDFYSFVDSSDPAILAAKVKGLVGGISLMQAITSLLESKNLGYRVTYNLDTKIVSFEIITGRNLCDGFTSVLHGENLPNTVTLSVRSETLKDIRSNIDMSPYKTRVYVKNFDDMKIFNRGETKTGIELREGYLSTGHGNLGGDWEIPDPPVPPEIIVPPPELPPEIPIDPVVPDRRLLGLYVLTNQNRLLACAFYPGLPVPDVWFDVTPEGAPPLWTRGSAVVAGTGDLVVMGADRQKIYRVSMTGGWFGTKYFSQAVTVLDAVDLNVRAAVIVGAPDPLEVRQTNIIASMAVDDVTGRVVGTITSPYVSSPTNSAGYTHMMLEGSPYEIRLAKGPYSCGTAYPGWGNEWPWLSIRDGVLVHTGIGIFFITSDICLSDGGVWEGKTHMALSGNTSHRSWHAQPKPESDFVYFTNINDPNVGVMFRSRDRFEGTPIETWEGPGFGWVGNTSFSPDGLKMVNLNPAGINFCILDQDKFEDSIATVLTPQTANGQSYARVCFAGINDITGSNLWGLLLSGRSVSTGAVPTFKVTPNEDFTGLEDMTPALKVFLAAGPHGISGEGLLNEWPVWCWPILG